MTIPRIPHDRRTRRLQMLRGWLMVAVGAITTYLLLERSHAEEVGNGSRVLAEIVRGERPLTPLSWAAFGLLTVVLVLSGQPRFAVPARVPHGR